MVVQRCAAWAWPLSLGGEGLICRARGTLLLPAPVALLLVLELEQQVLRVFTLAAEAIDSDAQVLQMTIITIKITSHRDH